MLNSFPVRLNPIDNGVVQSGSGNSGWKQMWKARATFSQR
jgi:hypothetical protein